MQVERFDFQPWRNSCIADEVMRWANSFADEAREEWASLLEREPTDALMKELPTLFMELRAKMVTASDFASVELIGIQPEGENGEQGGHQAR